LAQYLLLLELGDNVFDAGPEAAVCRVVVVADDPADVVARLGGDDAAVSAVAEDDTTIKQLQHSVASAVLA